MREQVCIYACPWPRIQAAMMDEDTITIGYRDWRGEPRGKAPGRGRKSESRAAGPGEARAPKARADCIDCMACVNVCPMGIDIRNGQQMECITCGLCIDACDDVMDKIGKPRGLIDYMALSDEPASGRAVRPSRSGGTSCAPGRSFTRRSGRPSGWASSMRCSSGPTSN
jgi:cytochrome c oxidase accessory protein FixG